MLSFRNLLGNWLFLVIFAPRSCYGRQCLNRIEASTRSYVIGNATTGVDGLSWSQAPKLPESPEKLENSALLSRNHSPSVFSSNTSVIFPMKPIKRCSSGCLRGVIRRCEDFSKISSSTVQLLSSYFLLFLLHLLFFFGFYCWQQAFNSYR